jgi:hypothetical protein
MGRAWVPFAVAFALALSAVGASASPTGKEAPRVQMHGEADGFAVVFRESTQGCEGPRNWGRILVWNQTHRLVVTTGDICSERAWHRAGHLPGGFSPHVSFLPGEGAIVNIVANGDNATAGYGVIARTKDDRATGTLIIHRERFWHYERIYEGADAFVNFCIDRSREIRSSGGRLYCVRESPVRGPNLVRFRLVHP